MQNIGNCAKEQNKIDPVFLLLIILAGVLIFSNLGNIYLWQDEATTAVVARNVLSLGLPYAYNIFPPDRDNPKQLCFFQPWLQFYLVSLSFLLFGISTWSARFPFALLGVISCVAVYFLSLKLIKDRLTARISTFLLVCSVPFLLHVRQCRYYALVILLTILSMLAYREFLNKRRYSRLNIALVLILLFHSNYAVFITVFCAFMVHYIIYGMEFQKTEIPTTENRLKGYRRRRFSCHFRHGYNTKFLLKDLATVSVVILFTVSFFFYIRVIHGISANPPGWTAEIAPSGDFLNHIKKQLEFYLRTLTKFVVPAVFFAILFIACRLTKRRFLILPDPVDKTFFQLFILIIVFSLIFLAIFVEQRHFRYIIYLLPLFYVLEGIFFAGWLKIPNKRRIAAVIILVALVGSNFLFRPNDVKFRLFDYLYEITHDYDDVTEGIVKFLKTNAKPGQTVKVPYDGSPVKFYYEELNIDYKDGEDFIKDETYPDWIIYRRFWVPEEFFNSEYYKNIKARYQEIPLTGYRDLKWGNMPDPGEHRYRTETDFLEQVPVIYKKIK